MSVSKESPLWRDNTLPQDTHEFNHKIVDRREPGFYMADNELIDVYGPVIGAYGVAVYNVLARYASRHGAAFPSYKTIAMHINVSRPTAIAAINTLIEYGLIAKERRGDANGNQASNLYILLDIKGGGKGDLLGGGKGDLLGGGKGDLPGW